VKALVVDDDRVLADVVAFALRREGFDVIQAHTGQAAVERWASEQPDLVVLDVNLPQMDGFEVCRRIREQSDTPVIMLTVRGDEDDMVNGLRLGADDYIAKPFSPRQLVARAHAVLRRAGKAVPPPLRQVGSLQLDLGHRELKVAEGQAVQLTPLECRLMDFLLINVGQVLPNEMIIDYVWGPQGSDRDTLRQLVRRLRAKMATACGLDAGEPLEAAAVYIETIPSLGYQLRNK
jgi:DNA-binding response OmpR family regulator